MKLLSRLTGDTSSSSSNGQTLLTGWGRTSPSRATVVRPASTGWLASLIRQHHPRGIIARGLGRSYGDPAQNAGGTVIDMTAMNAVRWIDLEMATVSVDAGISLHRMMQLFVPLGMFVPVTPGTRYVTVGGAIASDIHGKNHHVDGTFCDHVLSFELMLPSGEIRRVGPTTEPELFAATRGGMGLTGFILSAEIQMIPVDTSIVMVDTERLPNVDALLARMTEDDDRFRYSVAWVDTLATGKHLGRGVLYRGNHQSAAQPPDQAIELSLEAPNASSLSIPDIVPGGLVGLSTARIFNEVWYRKHPALERERPEQLSAFFHQLDMVENTNRIYGSHGFVQHQCVLPADQTEALLRILEILSGERVPTYLVVLKRMGPGTGLLSFPIAGWTLAVDIPAGWHGLSELLDRLDEIVVEAGGRLYLAKDSRMNPLHLPVMYPELDKWRALVDQHDPNRRFVSDLSRRLNLRGTEEA